MIWLLAQLVEPALQPGPVRLPGQIPVEQPQPREPQPSIELSPELRNSPLTKDKDLSEQLQRCQEEATSNSSATLERCAAALTAELIQRGYINSRVVVDQDSQIPRLELIEGRLVELRVSGPDEALNKRSPKTLPNLPEGSVNKERSFENFPAYGF